MNQENQSQRPLTEEEIYGFEWRTRQMLEQGETPDEVEQKLVAAGFTQESAKHFVTEIAKHEKEGRRNNRGEFVGSFVAYPIIGLGFLLIIGNVTGIFPTFPYAGFITIILGAVIGGIVGAIASKTVK